MDNWDRGNYISFTDDEIPPSIEKLYIFQQDVKGALFPLVDKGFESHAKVKIKCSSKIRISDQAL